MGKMEELLLKIRRREGRVYSLINDAYKNAHGIHLPVCRPLYSFLYYERKARLSFFRNLLRIFYYEPMFKSRCAEYGRGCRLIQAIPLIDGNIQIYLGDNVVIDGTNTFESTSVIDKPVLRIGSNTFLGYHVSISAGKSVLIGENCFLAKEVTILDNDGHPLDPIKRAMHERVAESQIKPVQIGNFVWIGSYAVILKGVRIGDGAVIGANSNVTTDIPPFCIASGNPAKVIKFLDVEKIGISNEKKD